MCPDPGKWYVSNNLSKWKFQGDTIQFDVGTNSEAPLFFKIRSTNTGFYQLTASANGLILGKAENEAWSDLWKVALKSDFATTIEVLPSVTIVGNGRTEWLTYTPKKDGYKPIGIVGYAVGTNDGITMNQIYITNGVINYALLNKGTASQSTIPRAYVLWIKS